MTGNRESRLTDFQAAMTRDWATSMKSPPTSPENAAALADFEAMEAGYSSTPGRN
jgi:hypothetical protein